MSFLTFSPPAITPATFCEAPMTTDQTPDLAVYVDRILLELADLEVRKAALTLQLTGVRDKLKGFRTRKAKATNGSNRKVRKPAQPKKKIDRFEGVAAPLGHGQA